MSYQERKRADLSVSQQHILFRSCGDTCGFEDLLVWTYLLLCQILNFQILVFQQAYEYKKDLELYKFHYNVIPLEMSQEYKLVAEI